MDMGNLNVAYPNGCEMQLLLLLFVLLLLLLQVAEVQTLPKWREMRVTGAAPWQNPWQLSSQRVLQHYTAQQTSVIAAVFIVRFE